MIRWAVIEQRTATAVCLQLKKNASCDDCHAHCGQPIFDLFKQREGRLWIPRKQSELLIENADLLFGEQRQIGQTIGLSIDDKRLLKSALSSYLLPLLLLILLMAVGNFGFSALSWSADGGALFGLLLGLLLLWKRTKWYPIAQALPKVTIL